MPCSRGYAHIKPLVGPSDLIMELDGCARNSWPHGTTFTAVVGRHQQRGAPHIGLPFGLLRLWSESSSLLLQLWVIREDGGASVKSSCLHLSSNSHLYQVTPRDCQVIGKSCLIVRDLRTSCTRRSRGDVGHLRATSSSRSEAT